MFLAWTSARNLRLTLCYTKPQLWESGIACAIFIKKFSATLNINFTSGLWMEGDETKKSITYELSIYSYLVCRWTSRVKGKCALEMDGNHDNDPIWSGFYHFLLSTIVLKRLYKHIPSCHAGRQEVSRCCTGDLVREYPILLGDMPFLCGGYPLSWLGIPSSRRHLGLVTEVHPFPKKGTRNQWLGYSLLTDRPCKNITSHRTSYASDKKVLLSFRDYSLFR